MSRATLSRLGLLLLLAFLYTATPVIVMAQEMTAAELVALPPTRDGEQVVMVGEAVGDVMRAVSGGVWVNVLSGGTAVGVWTTPESGELIETLGDHKNVGDVVRVSGVLNFGCDQHGGDFDVHAETIEMIEPGGGRQIRAEPWKLGVAGVLGVIAVVLGLLNRRRPDLA